LVLDRKKLEPIFASDVSLLVRLRGTPWTPEFMAAYESDKGIDAAVSSSRSRSVVPGTWRRLCVKYFAECTDYLRLDERTKRLRRAILESTFRTGDHSSPLPCHRK
jgi:hypothetical protein